MFAYPVCSLVLAYRSIQQPDTCSPFPDTDTTEKEPSGQHRIFGHELITDCSPDTRPPSPIQIPPRRSLWTTSHLRTRIENCQNQKNQTELVPKKFRPGSVNDKGPPSHCGVPRAFAEPQIDERNQAVFSVHGGEHGDSGIGWAICIKSRGKLWWVEILLIGKRY
jgi:hypothetical protein